MFMVMLYSAIPECIALRERKKMVDKFREMLIKATLCDFYPHLVVKRYMTIQ